jgi:hypothetical protein
MTSSTIVGVDPGAHGAIAILDETGQLLGIEDMPTSPAANGRTATNAPLLAGLLARPCSGRVLRIYRGQID